MLPSTPALGKSDDIPQEYYVKAKYLLNFPLVIEARPQAINSPLYTICVSGDTPLENVLMLSKSKLIKNRQLNIKKVDSTTQPDGCQMLFIASSERHRLQTLLPEAHRRGTLTVSDMRDFTRLGGIIGLLTVDNRVTFDLNLSVASKASISFSTHLLKLAHDVID